MNDSSKNSNGTRDLFTFSIRTVVCYLNVPANDIDKYAASPTK